MQEGREPRSFPTPLKKNKWTNLTNYDANQEK